jgi:quinolinate synthase
MLWQPSLPDHYLEMTPEQLGAAIETRRRELGSDLLILGHHYQQDDVIRHADLTGDSLQLSQSAAAEAPRRGTKHIVFCGVHFMAETADMLTEDDVQVVLPDLSAGCSMADMAELDDVVEAWDAIGDALGDAARVIPITYVNSSAAIKAFVGDHGGACCTSSNARQIFEWALAGGDGPDAGTDPRVLFLPDQHLGRNTARAFGLVTDVDAAGGGGEARTAVWDPRHDLGGIDPETIRRSRVLLWAGHCSVHKLFRPEHVDQVRARFEDQGGVTVIVHPECSQEVVEKADLTGSTGSIIRTIEQAEPGTSWAIGTEVHLVARLARAAAERGVHVRILSECQCLCTTMYRIDEPHLLWALDHLAEGRVVNRVRVPREVREPALLALRRMLEHVGGTRTATALAT